MLLASSFKRFYLLILQTGEERVGRNIGGREEHRTAASRWLPEQTPDLQPRPVPRLESHGRTSVS